jgi:hypothetical protein
MRHLTDDELLRQAYVQLDPITSTELERELLRRFQEGIAQYEPVAEQLDDFDFSNTKDIDRFKALMGIDLQTYQHGQTLLDVLLDADIDDPAVLKQRLARLDKFDALMDDLVQPLATLQTLATTTE